MQQKIPCIPYLFDEGSREEPSRFQIFFRIGEYEYRYYIVLLHNEIRTETLYRRKLGASRAAKVFDRDNGEISLGTVLGTKNINTEVNAKMPLLSDDDVSKKQFITMMNDMGKSWIKPRRDSHQMISPEYHVIVSEGTKTEPFEARRASNKKSGWGMNMIQYS